MSFDFKYNYPQIARDSGFKLRQFRDGPLDWRIVGSLEVERILREQQFEHIDAVLFYLSEAPLASMLESNVLDSGIAKYFTLSQLALQYLIFCRKFLDETVRTLRESLVEAQVENVNLKTTNQEHSNEILQLHKKLSQIEAINEVVFPCHMCTKNFVSNDALNVHLSRKHSKSPTGDAQGKDNDRTLINTIKLELEIKQLKERLNIAEKDIRETVEGKKGSPREVSKICSSTQIKIATNDIGTQSNLFETKEGDCTDDVAANKLEILTQLEEKISRLEAWQETQRTENQQTINDITLKLSEIAESLQSRSEKDAEDFRKLAKDAILSGISSKQVPPVISANELQEILSNTVSEVMHLNSEKLNEILTKIETIYEEKLPKLQSEIQRGKILVQQQIKDAMSKPPMANPINSNTEEYSCKKKESSPHNSRRTYSIERSPVRCSDAMQLLSDASSTDVSQEMLESQENEVEKTVPTATKKSEEAVAFLTSPKKVIKTIERKMASYGISQSAKTLSASEMVKISAQIGEKRSSLKKVYPRFYATRNKLKNLVDRLSSKHHVNERLHDAELHETTKHKIKTNSLENSSKIKPKSSYPDRTSDKNEYDGDAFKKRLEKILSSPIKKPTTFVPNRSKQPTKPVPMPRKRVMFSNAGEGSSGDEVVLSTPRSKTALEEYCRA